MKSSITGLSGLLALAALVAGNYWGLGYLVGAVAVIAVVFGFGWPHYLGIPAKKTLGTVIALTGVASALAAGLSAEVNTFGWSPIFVAVGFGAVMAVQLIRGTGQKHRLESTLGAGAGVALAGFGGGWVASQQFLEDPGMSTFISISAAVALLIGMLPWPDRVNAPLAIVLAGLAGPLAATLVSDVRIVPAAIIGVLIGAVIASFRSLRTLTGPPKSTFGAVSAALAPILSMGALVYFVEKLLLT